MSELILVTGSSDGLGLAAGRELIADGHRVVLHARNQARAAQTRMAAPGAHQVVVADFSSFDQVRAMAGRLAGLGRFDAIVHNAGVGYREPRRIGTADGHAHVLQINVLSPFVLTALLPVPRRMVWLSSGLHREGVASVDDLDWTYRPWNGLQSYADSKLIDAALAFGLAARWPDAVVTALEPGWVATKMGGPGAPDDLDLAHRTQVWLAEGGGRTGGYYYHMKPAPVHPAVRDPEFQDTVIRALERLTGERVA